MKIILFAILTASLLFSQAAGTDISAASPPPAPSQSAVQPAPLAPQSGSEIVSTLNEDINIENKWMDDAFFLNKFCNPARSQLGHFDLFAPAALMLIVISLAIAIVYMLSSVFDSPMLAALAKEEGYEIMLTILIFFGFFSISSLLNNVVLGAGGGNDGFMGTASHYSKTMILKISQDLGSLALFNMFLHMYYSAPLKFGKAAYAGISFNLGAVLRPIIDGISVAANLLSIALGEWLANLSLLCFIKRVAIPVMLPLGLLLRSVPQLRGGGNAFIAFAFVLFLVYPAMLTINSQAYEIRYGTTTAGMPIQNAVAYFLTQWGAVGGAAMLLGLKTITGTALGALFLVSAGMLFLHTISDMVYTIFILSFFLPLLNIFVTLTFAKELAKFLGTEINVSAFVKLI